MLLSESGRRTPGPFPNEDPRKTGPAVRGSPLSHDRLSRKQMVLNGMVSDRIRSGAAGASNLPDSKQAKRDPEVKRKGPEPEVLGRRRKNPERLLADGRAERFDGAAPAFFKPGSADVRPRSKARVSRCAIVPGRKAGFHGSEDRKRDFAGNLRVLCGVIFQRIPGTMP